NDRQLLKIFFAKHRRFRLQNVEEFSDDRADAAKMSGPRFSLEQIRKRILVDENRSIAGVQFFRARTKKKIDTGVAAEVFILLFRPRITFIIGSRLELKRIHKDADCDFP